MKMPALIMLSVEKLEFKRAHFHLGPLSFTLPPGEILRVIGKNGAGKTSLMKLILGMLRPAGGQVLHSGRTIGQVGVSPSLFEAWTVRENLTYLEQIAQVKIQPFVRERLQFLESFRVHQLSSGLRRDVELSLQLGMSAPLYLLDEAFTHLDPQRSNFFESLILKMRDEGHSFLVTAHSQQERFSDQCGALTL
jgi:ABC-type multidrug transport system ATPase subunit